MDSSGQGPGPRVCQVLACHKDNYGKVGIGQGSETKQSESDPEDGSMSQQLKRRKLLIVLGVLAERQL